MFCVCVCCVCVCVCVCTHYVYSLCVFYRKEKLPTFRLFFFSLVQTQTIACFELSDFSGYIAPLQWLYGQPPWHTPETEHNGYPQFTGGFTQILSKWVCTFTPRNGVDVGCPQLPCVCVCVCHDHTIYEKQKLIVDIEDEDDSDDSYSTK